jgi:hypothetical protein
MYIIFVSNNAATHNKLLQKIDNFILYHHLSHIDLYSYSSININNIYTLDRFEAYYFLLDIDSQKYSIKDIMQLTKYFSFSKIGIYSKDEQYFLNLCNYLPLQGYINVNQINWEKSLLHLLIHLNKQNSTIPNGLFISTKQTKELIPFNYIYYIETIKGSHYCKIICDKKSHIFRGNIYETITMLDKRFLIVRASTIVNLDKIISIDTKNKYLHFNNNEFCSYSAKNYKKICKKIKKIYTQ